MSNTLKGRLDCALRWCILAGPLLLAGCATSLAGHHYDELRGRRMANSTRWARDVRAWTQADGAPVHYMRVAYSDGRVRVLQCWPRQDGLATREVPALPDEDQLRALPVTTNLEPTPSAGIRHDGYWAAVYLEGQELGKLRLYRQLPWDERLLPGELVVRIGAGLLDLATAPAQLVLGVPMFAVWLVMATTGNVGFP